MLSTTTSYEDLIHSTDATNLLEELSRAELSRLASIKKCRVCEQNKPRSEFPRHRHSHDNFDSRCRSCKNEQTRLRKAFRRDHPVPPPGPCPLCNDHTDSWVVDHNHNTDELRGYCCPGCNLGIGHFKDNPEAMERAARWVRGRPAFNNSPPRHLL
jgi:hypothetical protein